MATDQSTEPIEVRYLGVNLSGEVGANDTIMAVRVVEDRREGSTIFGRTLRADEIDDNAPILIRPSVGETLVFLPEATQVRLADADRYVKAEADGYRPITNTIWTWLSFGLPTDRALFRTCWLQHVDSTALTPCWLRRTPQWPICPAVS